MMEEQIEALKLALTQPRRRAPGTITSYLSTASIFLTWLGEQVPPTTQDLRRFFAAREEQGISPRSRATQFTQIKKLYLACEWPWPFTRDDMPVADDDDLPFAPAFTLDEVCYLIAQRKNYTPQETFYLALATTYGLRREEIGRVTKRDIQGTTIRVRTAKHGQQRTHLIPNEIMPALEIWHPRKRDAWSISYNFRKITEKSGLGYRPRWGFHSIRRPLLTALIINLAKADYPPSLAAEFLRWSKRSIGAVFLGSPMAGLYTHPEAISADPFNLDRTVFNIHPFLKEWAKCSRCKGLLKADEDGDMVCLICARHEAIQHHEADDVDDDVDNEDEDNNTPSPN